MPRIALLSDTHSFLDPGVAPHIQSCDEVWHAGDIGSLAVTDALQSIKPLKAVFGNIDHKEIQGQFPEDLAFDCGGVKVLMTHIGGNPPKYNQRTLKLLREHTPGLFICGHSHILKVGRDKDRNMWCLNPGAAGNHGLHHMKTLVRFTLERGQLSALEVVELGVRGKG